MRDGICRGGVKRGHVGGRTLRDLALHHEVQPGWLRVQVRVVGGEVLKHALVRCLDIIRPGVVVDVDFLLAPYCFNVAVHKLEGRAFAACVGTLAYQLRVHPEGAGGELWVDIADMHSGSPRSPNGDDGVLRTELRFF